jgi:hypothetical protein
MREPLQTEHPRGAMRVFYRAKVIRLAPITNVPE